MRTIASNRSMAWLACASVIAALAATAQPPAYAAQKKIADASPRELRSARAGAAAIASAPWKRPDFGREKPSKDAYQVAYWVLNSGDNEGSSFVIVDKSQAKIYVFDTVGHLHGAAAVLLGMAKGDDTAPGVGDRELSNIAPGERTTPAGRFVAEPGRNAHGADIVWVDYEAAVSMHRVLTNNPAERRLERLSSPKPSEHRISFGCINLPTSFYEQVLAPTVNKDATIIYVLPETRSPADVFGYRVMGRGRPPQSVPKTASAHYLAGA